MNEGLAELATLLRERDGIEKRIADMTGRSARQGDVGEFIAAEVFGIELARNAVQAGHDGWFRSGPLRDRSVNVKAYTSLADGIDISPHPCDYYLVLDAGRRTGSGVRHHRWRITEVLLFDARRLLAEFAARGVKVGYATSLRVADRAAARLYPTSGPGALLDLTVEQRAALDLFA
ncbi:DUF6998 domain-containing protein [Actinoplanes utahensis]|uniref:DUF6998 domain-containing protein n=1 Tax=Actinoplanes utahensis TaxID=1869 RepID=A0A0A6X0N6_ACTUT|nr:hypothetical protein [Actinoplanes utahensis]KHD73582.1 hypothetical protein MB27_34245 [Actinoplanes utahensis]GIF33938.1 hypothetical protein Aut01nite_69240 [Actinoplanes utahensis]